MELNETHDPQLASWVESANDPATDFPIQNLPFGVFRRANSSEEFRGGTAIGEDILDLQAVVDAGLLTESDAAIAAIAARPHLNELMSAGPSAWSALRRALSRVLRKGSPLQDFRRSCLIPQKEAEYTVPARIGDYTDFYTSSHHATAVGRFFRPDNPLLPNYKWVPIGYHGRCSSIGVSGQTFPRPCGQRIVPGDTVPSLGPSTRLDYEVELGVFIGPGNAPGSRIELNDAENHVFGLCLLNDWSARDIQSWEYQPLGPFLAKNFATTISPWIVTLEALEPHRTSWARPPTDPTPLPYLDSPVAARSAFEIVLEAYIQTEQMRRAGLAPERLSRSSFKHAYWTIAQMVAHHTINGCNLRPGDLLGTGTQSGPRPEEAGSLLEISRNGLQPISLRNTETRTFLEDGDRVILRGICQRVGFPRIGFGEASGQVLPANIAHRGRFPHN
jgi:fumarylacetoacetase